MINDVKNRRGGEDDRKSNDAELVHFIFDVFLAIVGAVECLDHVRNERRNGGGVDANKMYEDQINNKVDDARNDGGAGDFFGAFFSNVDAADEIIENVPAIGVEQNRNVNVG